MMGNSDRALDFGFWILDFQTRDLLSQYESFFTIDEDRCRLSLTAGYAAERR